MYRRNYKMHNGLRKIIYFSRTLSNEKQYEKGPLRLYMIFHYKIEDINSYSKIQEMIPVLLYENSTTLMSNFYELHYPLYI